MRRVLVIKLGALGDFVQALGAFAAIRRHHAEARITLLTTAPFKELAEAGGYFDEVWIDQRSRPWQPKGWLKLARRLNAGDFERVYDLQTSDRSAAYFRLMGPLFGGKRPEWSGIARGCSHRHANPNRKFMHTIERLAEQLAMAGIRHVPPADLSWAGADVSRFELAGDAGRYALLVPGSSPHRPEKRWPEDRFAALGRRLASERVTPVLLGAGAESEVNARVRGLCPDARDLCGETSFIDIVALARGAAGALGNDTGPMHLIAAAGCPTVVLFSAASDPARCAPRGPQGADSVTVIRRDSLDNLMVDEVASALNLR